MCIAYTRYQVPGIGDDVYLFNLFDFTGNEPTKKNIHKYLWLLTMQEEMTCDRIMLTNWTNK